MDPVKKGRPQVVSVIVAMARNRVIGTRNGLPWHLPADLAHFKRLTMGHHILMGRRTYESIGRPLPGRTTVIITRDPAYRPPGCLVAASLAEALALGGGDPEVFFVGGAQIYAQALPLADRLYLTEIDADFEGDAWFPDFDRGQWRETERQRQVGADGLVYAFVTLDRQPAK